MFCPKCGAMNGDNNDRCFICQYDLRIAREREKARKEEQEDNIKNDLQVNNVEVNIKEKKKKKNNKILLYVIPILVFIFLSFMCIILGTLLTANQNAIKEILKDNDIETSLFDKNDETTPPDIYIDDDGNVIYEKDFKYTDLKYEKLDLQKTTTSTFEIELPKEMEYIEIEDSDREEYELSEYFNVWRGGYDFDIIKTDIITGYDDIYEVAQMFYKNAEETIIPGSDNECAYNDIKIEKATVSGYDAYKVSAFMKTHGEIVVTWIFKAPDIDEYIHVIAADVVYEDMVLLNFIDTYKYNGLS